MGFSFNIGKFFRRATDFRSTAKALGEGLASGSKKAAVVSPQNYYGVPFSANAAFGNLGAAGGELWDGLTSLPETATRTWEEAAELVTSPGLETYYLPEFTHWE
jgi:hypothetical protein